MPGNAKISLCFSLILAGAISLGRPVGLPNVAPREWGRLLAPGHVYNFPIRPPRANRPLAFGPISDSRIPKILKVVNMLFFFRRISLILAAAISSGKIAFHFGLQNGAQLGHSPECFGPSGETGNHGNENIC
jgi:hypothetical protein